MFPSNTTLTTVHTVEARWDRDCNWYGGWTKLCIRDGQPVIVFAFQSWCWEAGVEVADDQAWVSGVIHLADWQGWSDSFRTKRRTQPTAVFAALDQYCQKIGGPVRICGDAQRAKTLATKAFRALPVRLPGGNRVVVRDLIY
jgi:hypothetical protein